MHDRLSLDNETYLQQERHKNTMSESAEQADSKKISPLPLPLGWTQVRRKQRSRDSTEESNQADEIDWCCDDPNCMRTARNMDVDAPTDASITVKGHAMFCLHEMDPSWFQGYLQVEGQRKPWGLLAIQETIDECLECKDGGYRQITLKAFPYNTKEPHVFENVAWTGGDMIRLQSTSISMETHSLWTGKKAVPFTERFFGSLVDKLRAILYRKPFPILPL